MFNKQDIQNDNKYSFLKERLSDDFSVPDDGRSKVVFGYNGIGKTTIFRFIKEFKNDNRIVFLDYIDERDTFIKKKKKLTVSANVNRIDELNKEIQDIKSAMSVKETVKVNFGISNATLASSFGEKMIEAQKDSFLNFTLSREEIESPINLLNEVPAKFIVNNKDILQGARALNDEIKDYDSSFIYRALIPLSEIVKSEDIVCPICGSNKEDIYEHINQKLALLSNVTSELVQNLKSSNIQVSETNISNMIDIISTLNDNDKISDWMICNGDIDRYDMLVLNRVELTRKETELSALQTQRDTLYMLLKANELAIKDEISRYFGISERSIRFSDTKKTLAISLEREVKTYSTGEMNFFAFMIKIYEFIGSDKEILILDDPVSSLDIINHYKIAYKLVKTASTGKNVIVLTHSVELLNTINSQFANDFDYYYIDETTTSLIIQDISGVPTGNNVLTLNRLLSIDHLEIIKALIEKENSDNSNDIHKLFHYAGSFLHPNFNLFSNDFFVYYIENYEDVQNSDFLSNSYNKIITIAALRVWAEKQLRDLVLNNPTLLSNLDGKYTITQKINYLFPQNGHDKTTKPQNFTREKILSKKVMLNQGIHYQSQVMPFAYAINISLNDLSKEVVEIKELFE